MASSLKSLLVCAKDSDAPYKFCAKDTGGTEYTVNIVMPLGGAQSGLFRYPKVGEKVLVGVEGEGASAEYYLLGYLPDETADNNFDTEGDGHEGILPGKMQGEVFRYQKTGTNESDMKYSEIGFYNQETSWKKPSTSTTYPSVDRINIQSTGDIYSNAQNYHEIMAKRFELLVNEEAGNHKTEEDDAMLLAGDMRVKAKNRITIEAGQEIEIKVGRSSIKISDKGIELRTGKGQAAPGPWDTTIELDPRGGLSMFGQEVEIGSVFGYKLKDAFGSSIGGESGAIGISAGDINIETIDRVVSILHLAATLSEMVWAVSAVSTSIGGGDADKMGKALPALQGASSLLRDVGTNVVAPDDDEGFEVAVVVLKMILSIIKTVINICDTTISPKFPTIEEQQKCRDQLNLAAIIIEWGFITFIQAYKMWSVWDIVEYAAESKLSLSPGKLEMEGITKSTVTVSTKDLSSPKAGFLNFLEDAASKGMREKLHMGTNAVSSLVDLTADLADEYYSADIREALKEL
jgi:hypothetical protein